MNDIKVIPAKVKGQCFIASTKKEDGTNSYLISMKTAFGHPKAMVTAIRTLRRATASDTVNIVINSPGGNVAAVVSLLGAIKACKAKVHTHVSGLAASCGFILWIHGDTKSCAKYGAIMAHGTSHGAGGNSVEIKERASAIEETARSLMEIAVSTNVLTETEFEEMFNKKLDIYMDYNFLNKRGVLSNADWNI